MKNLKVWQKLALLGVIFMLPFAAVTYTMVSSINKLGIEFARQEIRGLEYYTPLLDLLKDMQRHRGAASAWLNGDASFKHTLAERRSDIEGDIRKVDEIDRRLGVFLKTGKKWAEVRAEILGLLEKTSALSSAESFQQHKKVIAEIVVLITAVGDASNLTLDPDLDSYYLMDVIIFQGPALSDLLAQARGLGSAMAAGKNGTPAQFEELYRLSILAEFLREGVADSLHKALECNPSLQPQLGKSVDDASAATKEAVNYVTNLGSGRKMDVSAVDYYDMMTKKINLIFEMQKQASISLNGLITNRIEKFYREVTYTLAGAAFGLLMVSIIGFFIIRDITRPLQRVVGIADQIARGDLETGVVFEPRKDEIGVLALAFDRMVGTLKETAAVATQIAAGNLAVTVRPLSERDVMGNALEQMVFALKKMVGVAEQIAAGNLSVAVRPQSELDVMGKAFATMIQKLSLLVGELQKSAMQVNTSVTEIAATGHEQQATANETAATVSEIGATAKEITATARELGKTVDEVARMVEQTAGFADTGQSSLTRMGDTMGHIKEAGDSINAKLTVLSEKASNINQVVITITKVADQTNLLSLNAAIEAEKAGEYGRGFAVVAMEIRRLADQTAVAMYDIDQTVKEMQSATSAGVMSMDKFSEEVRGGVQEIQQVSLQLGQIIQQVQGLTPRFETVNEGVQVQATGAQQISEALGQLSEAAQQTVESLSQSNQGIEQLRDVSQRLKSSMEQFKV